MARIPRLGIELLPRGEISVPAQAEVVPMVRDRLRGCLGVVFYRLPYIAMCAALTASLPAEARTRTALVDSGWYGGRFFDHDPENTNYAVLNRDFAHARRAFLVFRIPKTSRRFARARLRIFTYGVGSAEQIVGLYDVHTPIRHLRAGGRGMQVIYDDLGTGTRYGEAIVSKSDKFIEISLSADAVVDINARRGGFFAIGLANETARPGINWVFGASEFNRVNQLILDHPKRSKRVSRQKAKTKDRCRAW